MLSSGCAKEVNIYHLLLLDRSYCYLLQIDKHRYTITISHRLYTGEAIDKVCIEKLQVDMKQL